MNFAAVFKDTSKFIYRVGSAPQPGSKLKTGLAKPSPRGNLEPKNKDLENHRPDLGWGMLQAAYRRKGRGAYRVGSAPQPGSQLQTLLAKPPPREPILCLDRRVVVGGAMLAPTSQLCLGPE